MNINFYYDGINYRIREGRKVKNLIEKVIRKKNMIPGDLSYIFTNDKEILRINIEFLKHNYYTDVIAFDDREGKNVKGEIYISYETVKRNAANYNVSLKKEMLRVIIHGTLHLCGYSDKDVAGRKVMTEMENYWLEISKNSE